MTRRNLLLLGGAAAASIAGAVLLTPKRTEPPVSGDATLAFPGLAARLPNAAAIEIVRSDATLTIARQGDVWVLPVKDGYPVRTEKLRELLVGLTELRLTEPRTANPEQLDRLGLEEPTQPGATSALIRLVDAQNGTIAALITGRRRVRTQGNTPETIYVRRPGENQAWLAEGRLSIDADPQLWLNRDIANFPRDRVRRILVSRDGEPPLEVTRSGEPDGRYSIAVPADAPPADETGLDEMGRGFEFLTFLDLRKEADIPGTTLGQAVFELTDNLSVTVRVNKEGEAIWLRLAAAGDDEAARLNARWRGWAYQVGHWKEKAFLPRLAELGREEPRAPEAPPTPPAQ